MNLKFYLRGLGIGIVVTAIIMLVIFSNTKAKLSDDEIKKRASMLGMVEGNMTLDEIKPDNISSGDATTDSTGDTDNIENGDSATASEGGESSDHLDEVEKILDEADAYLEDKNASDSGSVSTPEATEEPTANPTEKPTPEPTQEPTPKPTAESTPKPTQEPTPEPTQAPTAKPTEQGGRVVTIEITKGQDSYTVAKKLESLGLIANAYSFDSYLCSNGMDRKIKVGSYDIPEGSTEEDIASIIAG